MQSTLKCYTQLMKFRLSATVVFSALIGYLLGTTSPDFSKILLLILGGILVTGSANALNQILERNYDKLMKRTAIRPLPAGNLTLNQALIFSFIIGMQFFRIAFYFTLCACVYTPEKSFGYFCFNRGFPRGNPSSTRMGSSY